MAPKNTLCIWYDGTALEAAQFYAQTFPDSAVGTIFRAPGDYPAGKEGDVLTVAFTIMGIPCIGLNGGPEFKHSEAFSFQSPPTTRPKPTACGTPSSTTAARPACVAGARTDGASPGRSRPAP